jgi:acetylornithine deacetylase/succinyl-diaminopimelate desuccinylase-like protein
MSILDDMINQVDACTFEIIELEQNLVRIPSVNTGFMPTGDETDVCRYVKEFLSKYSIDAEILESAPNRGNLVARMDGSSGNAGLLFMSHTDVVPVEDESKWTYPPFEGRLIGDRIHGRGSSDCKGLLTAQLIAMTILKRNSIQLRDSLILASGADEEHGGRYGFGWLAENHPDRIMAPYAVNEGGGGTMDAAAGFTYILGTGEKGRLQIEIDIKGESAHASRPWQGINSTFGLGKVIEGIEKYEPARDTSVEFFKYLSTFALEYVATSQNIDGIIGEVEPKNKKLASVMRALSRMTVTPTMVQGGIKSNSVPEHIRLTCDVRTLPHQDENYLRQELDTILKDIPGVEYQVDYMSVPNSSPFDTELSRAIKRSTARALEMDDIQIIPSISTGFTDSRFTRNLGIVTYGFTGAHPDDNVDANIHGTNESQSVKSLINSTKVMLILAYDMLVDA